MSNHLNFFRSIILYLQHFLEFVKNNPLNKRKRPLIKMLKLIQSFFQEMLPNPWCRNGKAIVLIVRFACASKSEEEIISDF